MSREWQRFDTMSSIWALASFAVVSREWQRFDTAANTVVMVSPAVVSREWQRFDTMDSQPSRPTGL